MAHPGRATRKAAQQRSNAGKTPTRQLSRSACHPATYPFYRKPTLLYAGCWRHCTRYSKPGGGLDRAPRSRPQCAAPYRQAAQLISVLLSDPCHRLPYPAANAWAAAVHAWEGGAVRGSLVQVPHMMCSPQKREDAILYAGVESSRTRRNKKETVAAKFQQAGSQGVTAGAVAWSMAANG